MTHFTLTRKLRDTLALVVEGDSIEQIAWILGISHTAAADRVKRLIAYYGARNRAHMAAIAVRRGDV